MEDQEDCTGKDGAQMKGDADLSEASVLVEPFTRSGAAGITSGDVEVLQACEGEAE